MREFGSWIAALADMAQWLNSCGVETVVMQSTGVYRIAVHDVLERHGLEVNLVDARGTESVPGRKSDVQECQWLLKLHTYGLLRSCFLPAPEIHAVRTVWRLRVQHVKDAGRCIQHMQKALIEMNVQLHNAISDLSGVTGQAIIRALLSGQVCLYYRLVTKGQGWIEPGAVEFEQRRQRRDLAAPQRKARSLGMQLAPAA